MGFLNKIFGKKNKEETTNLDFYNEGEEEDVAFARKFKAGGGMFFYCENQEESLHYLQEILMNEDISEVLCVEPKLISMINQLDCNYSTQSTGDQDIALINCEYLVALDGSIMISSDQTYHLKKTDLPKKIIVWATPGQIISSSSVGLAKIRYAKKNNIPSNITSIHGNQVQGFSSISTAKKLYLLLVEE
ncbi:MULTISPECIES: hypothetical protein [unclassified Apibacter]|uniref:hypothetical protein n=1 Tax=unclassified Apibacter TaxID=2630820 RepID=UPI00132CB489|nr:MULTISPECIES: hypothetical protein [unclassified Apibacter]MCX8677915.1 hypothetical protein [Apibacter sp. B3919]MXO25132.1 hypothetical protein [Apibacter sp. B3924]MXO27335.1 hypothetical protein [Apibacter sp. B3813]MXO29148.1 hypothetical protein [Apibacter sp. B3913]MXO31349.1 hypothetical protein [Apibacter sp. B3912]